MSNKLPFLQDIISDNDEYLLILGCTFDKTDDLDKKFILESVDFYEKHKHDSGSSI